MSPGGHLVTTALACGAAYAATGSPAFTAGMAAGGFLIDIDHVVDYVLFEGRRDLRPAAFLRYYLEGHAQRAVLLLHSYELAALLILLASATGWAWLWGYCLGMGLHLPLDIIFNGRFAPGGLVGFYSFACRRRAGFRMNRFWDAARLAPLEENFWVTFFRGARLRDAQPKPGRAPAEALDPGRLAH